MSFGPVFHKELSSPSNGDGRKLILSVDDELRLLYSRYKLLTASGYAVLSASDGVQALQIFASNAIDLVLIDFALDGMDGGLVAEAMKDYKPQVPIILVSGVDVPERCLAVVNSYVRKGEGPEPLLKSIRQLLSSSAQPHLVSRQAAS